MDQNRLSQKGGNLLPEGWAETTLSEIATVNPKNGELNTLLSGFIPMALAPTDFNGHLEFEEREWDEIKKKYTHFANGDVIFAKVTPCFENGKAAIVSDLPNGIGAGSSEFYVLRPLDKGISASYIFANIKSHEFMQTGAENMTGAVGLRRVPRKFVEGFKVNLPPKAEQRVIADKLDTLLAQVETTKARLDRIPQILKTFCQSVLASANRGKLTEEWRDKNGLSISDWTFDKAQNLCTKVQSGSTPKNNPFDQDGKIPFLKVYNIVNQEINFDYKPQFITENVHSSSLSRSITHPNDILMNIVGPPLGKVAVVSSQYPEWNLNQAITLFRVNPEKLKFKYLYYVLCEGELVRKVMPDTKGSVGQINISLSQCRDAIIPAPKLVEQTEIVRRVEQLFAHADKIEQQVQAAQQRVDKLTQSILAKAFRGELTTQWRKDNPDLITGDNSAEALLAKIKAEREAKSPKKRVKTKKAKG
jgi:type I restriction enzyme S subunit